MGKGSRNRQIRIADNTATANPEVKLSKKQMVKREEKKQKLKSYLTAICAIVICLAIVVVALMPALKELFEPKLYDIVAGTSDEYEIDDGMVAYYLYANRNYYANMYYYTYGQQVDVSGDTYREQFLSSAISTLKSQVALATKAKAEGMTLNEDDYQTIDDTIASTKESADSAGYSSLNKYYSAQFCKGVTEKVVRRCLEMEALANKYTEKLKESYNFEDAELDKYLYDHPESFRFADYISYTVNADYPADADEAVKKAALAVAKDKAEALIADAPTEEEFLRRIYDQMLADEAAKAAKEGEAASDTADTTADPVTPVDPADDTEEETKEPTAEEISTATESCRKTMSYTDPTSDVFAEWIFDEARAAGDTQVIDGTEACTAFFVSKAPYIHDYNTKNVRYVVLNATIPEDDSDAEAVAAAQAVKEKAEGLLKDFEDKKNAILAEKQGDEAAKAIEEAFAEIAKANSEDAGAADGGLFENLDQGETVASFNDWCYDENRKPGDTEIITSEYGYHLMYFIGDGEVAWKAEARTGLENDKYASDVEELEKTYPVVFDDKKLDKIPY